MIDPTTTTGTEPQDDGTPLESSADPGTPGGDDRNAESDKDWKALAISLQEKAAKVNELEAKVKALEGDPQQPPVAEDPEVQAKTNQIEDIEAQVRYWANPAPGETRKPDAVALMVLEEKAARLRLERDLILGEQLKEVPKEQRQAVIKHFNANRHRIGDITLAYNEIRTPTLEREVEELRTKLARLEKGPDPEVVNAPPTHGREITARETKKKLTEAQFDANAQQIRATRGELAYLKYVRENASSIG